MYQSDRLADAQASVERAQQTVAIVRRALWLILALAVVLIAAAVLVAADRWRATLFLGLAVIAAMVLTRSAVERVVEEAPDLAERPAGRAAIAAIVGGASESLLRLAAVVLILGAVAAIVAMARRKWRREDLVLAAAVVVGRARRRRPRSDHLEPPAGHRARRARPHRRDARRRTRRRVRRPARRVITVTAVALLSVTIALSAAAGPASAAPVRDVTPPDADPTELLERYAPVLALRQQSTPCGDGEPYLPIAVDHVLGPGRRRAARRRRRRRHHRAVGRRPGRRRRSDWALDFPGDALDPGCDYEEWFRSMDAEPAVYGRVVVDGEFLVAQYWLYYVYNDWNDRHESDWEMIQLVFDTPTVAGALEQGPALYAYAQHEGSEYAFLDDAVELQGATETEQGKVRLIGGAPVVYPGQGSHAAYFETARWFGKSGATGFGCDDTTPRLVEVRPEVIVLPTEAPGRW